MYNSPSSFSPISRRIGAAQKLIAIQVGERQQLKDLEDQILDVMLVLDSTHETIVSLIENYRRFRQHPCISNDLGDGDSDAIDAAFQEKQKEICSSTQKVQIVHAKLKSTIELVSYKGFLSYTILIGSGTAFKSLRPWEWELSQATRRRKPSRESHHSQPYRKEHAGWHSGQGLNYDNTNIPTCNCCISQLSRNP